MLSASKRAVADRSCKENKLLIAVSILGELVGVIMTPSTCRFTNDSAELDLGHAILLEKTGTRRISFRQMLGEYSAIKQRASVA